MLLKKWTSLPGDAIRLFDVNYNEKNFLVFFRITICLIALYDLVSTLADLGLLFSQSGTVLPQELIYLPSEYFDQLNWFFKTIRRYNAEPVFFLSIWWVYFGSLLALLLGLFSRVSAIIVLVMQLVIFRSFASFNYGYDNFLTMSFFYCVVFPVGKYYSLDKKIFRRLAKPVIFNYRRVLQLHLCMVYFFSGISKVVDYNWWNGNSIWRSLASLYNDYASMPPILMAIAGIGVVFLETFYPILVYKKVTRKITIILVIVMHLGIGFLLDLYAFAAIMIVWNISAFGSLTSLKTVNENNQ